MLVEELLLGAPAASVTIVSGQIADPFVLLRLSNGQVRVCVQVCACVCMRVRECVRVCIFERARVCTCMCMLSVAP